MDPFQQEFEALKKQNQELSNRLLKVEQQLATLSKKEMPKGIPVPVAPAQQQQPSESDTTGIILVVIGAVLCFTMIGAILGLPLLIWGIIRLVKAGKKSAIEVPVAALEGKQIQGEYKYLKQQDLEVKPEKALKEIRFEEKMGIKWMAWAGIITLVIGVGYFVRYAIENNWIDHMTRIVLGTLSGIGLVIGGHFIKKRKKYSVLGQVMIGGGFALTYFSVYAAYHFPEYRHTIGISQVTDIVLLTIVSVSAVLYALRENSRAITIGAFFLGFLTSLLGNDFEILTL
jgi:hypothetical protein